MRKLLRYLTVLLAALAVAGCIDYTEQYVIDEKGAGTLRIQVNISKPEEFAPHAALFAKLFPVDETRAASFFSNPSIKYIPGSFKITRRSDQQVIIAEYHFDSLENLNDNDGRRVWSARKDDKGNLDVNLTIHFYKGLDAEMTEFKAQRQQNPVLAGNGRFTVRVEFTKQVLNMSGLQQIGNALAWAQDLVTITNADNPNPEMTFHVTARGVPASSGKVFNLIYFAIVLVMVLGGYSSRLYGAALNFFALLFVSIICLNFFEPLAELSRAYVSFAPEFHAAVVFIVMFIVLTFVAQEFLIGRGREWLDTNRIMDMAGSILFGLFSGFLAAGAIAVFYYLLPFDDDAIQGKLDAANPPVLLRIYRVIANKAPGMNEFDPVGEFPADLKMRAPAGRPTGAQALPQKDQPLQAQTLAAEKRV